MKIYLKLIPLLLIPSLSWAEESNGLAPEVPTLNAKDNLYALEAKLPDLDKPYISSAPEDKKDGLVVGKLGIDGGDANAVQKFAEELAATAKDEKEGNTDSLLICYKGKLIFEAYFRRGRANFPHYQMSITKSYTALTVGRAMQLGLVKMEDLDKPVIGFFKNLDTSKLAPGSDSITLAQAMQMTSGIRFPKENIAQFTKDRNALQGQGEIQTYMQNSAPIPPAPREFKYQESDPAIAMQVVDAVAPGGAQEFILKEILTPLNIKQYQWEAGISGQPKSAAGSAFLSRDMIKFGSLIMNKGKWEGQQLIPEEYIARATTGGPVNPKYGFFWWNEDFKIGDKTYHGIQGRGAGGQFIFMFPEIDLVAVITAHNKGMGNMLQYLPNQLIPAFVGK